MAFRSTFGRGFALVVAVVLVAGIGLVSNASAAEQSSWNTNDECDRGYIVTLNDGYSLDDIDLPAGVEVTHRYRYVLNGFGALMSEDDAAKLRADPRVEVVAKDSVSVGVEPWQQGYTGADSGVLDNATTGSCDGNEAQQQNRSGATIEPGNGRSDALYGNKDRKKAKDSKKAKDRKAAKRKKHKNKVKGKDKKMCFIPEGCTDRKSTKPRDHGRTGPTIVNRPGLLGGSFPKKENEPCPSTDIQLS